MITRFPIEPWDSNDNVKVSWPQNHLSGHTQTFIPSYLPLVSNALHDEIGPNAVGTTKRKTAQAMHPVTSENEVFEQR